MYPCAKRTRVPVQTNGSSGAELGGEHDERKSAFGSLRCRRSTFLAFPALLAREADLFDRTAVLEEVLDARLLWVQSSEKKKNNVRT